MTQKAVPFLFMRGGTSRGPYFQRKDLPADLDRLSQVLISVVGSGCSTNIDGLGGGTAVTTKVAMLSPSERPGADVDYFFAQVSVEDQFVDYSPTCGNILVGVGPAAIEMGIVPPAGDQTPVRIHSVNTGAQVEALVQTPGGRVNYEGDIAIAGVPGGAAPVALNFLDVVGSRTGALLPTTKACETIEGYEVSCVDVAMPMVIGRAGDFGVTGYELPSELDANASLLKQIETVRLEAGRKMGLGDVSSSVVPKFGLISEARSGGHFSTRYFMPWKCHPTLAVTGSQCLAACSLIPGSIAEGIARPVTASPALLSIEHPAGLMEVTVTFERTESGVKFISAGLVRTARLIARGEVMVPENALAGSNDTREITQ
ncbi:4-oxalomesaconate tautomerase [Roseibium aggregatum]|uniref:4-oxalomesaconate tautomerase n=1 Tax=Roseibium aggregatum TaxID=187304 RepID=A0A939EEY1_9HYPH|nr:4-oxalomesaconate tautomerase [Roseibium aggregatum]MBN9671511.1 4-oxalomesaconate tautomerase [Roseibium aggregatum]